MTSTTQKARARAARAAMYEDLVVSAAERVFARQGYAATKVQDIAREAGVSLATLYAATEGKARIWQAVHARHLAHLAPPEGPPRLADEPRAYLRDLLTGVERYIRYMCEHVDYVRLHLMAGHAWALGTGPASTVVQLEAWERGRTYMAATLRHGIDLGVLLDDDPALLGQVMVGMHQVRLAHWVADDMRASHDEVVRGVLRQMVHAFCTPEYVPVGLELLP